jgi:hypothetical protein
MLKNYLGAVLMALSLALLFACSQFKKDKLESHRFIKDAHVLLPNSIASELMDCSDDSLIYYSYLLGDTIFFRGNSDTVFIQFASFRSRCCKDLDYYPSSLALLFLMRQESRSEPLDCKMAYSFARGKQVLFDVIDDIRTHESRKAYLEIGKHIVSNNSIGSNLRLDFIRYREGVDDFQPMRGELENMPNSDEYIIGKVFKICHNLNCVDSVNSNNFYIELYLKVLQNSCPNCTYDGNRMPVGDTIFFLLEPMGWYHVKYGDVK